ncbi:hypothetical protein N657DRAFT_644808 [Parathielavia appendiculata]|uniref:Uncharacterized protein n=1 Tax=Parathielavia appendiculata TaxID=2587402 RepID=A0AAN6Z561_9PEZI|nr:hypothetical protein N657DRAFT_644808 [Parathielavia appendiculata]
MSRVNELLGNEHWVSATAATIVNDGALAIVTEIAEARAESTYVLIPFTGLP